MSRKFFTKCVFELDSNDCLILIECHSFEYDGPIAECKKGREQAKTLTNDEIAREKALAAQQSAEQAAADKTIGTFETQGQPGQLSPAAAAQLAADNDNINRTYNGMRQTAFATMGARGFGNAPSGFGLAEQNAINRGQAQAGTGAFRNAQVNTQNLEDKALNARMGLSGQDMSGQTAAAGTGLQGAQAMNKMGSTLGDVAGGIAAIAPLAAAPFTGGASLLAYGLPKGTSFSNPFSKLGQSGGGGGSGVGGYDPSICWIASVLYNEDLIAGPRVNTVRNWLTNEFEHTFLGAPLVALYRKYGKRIASALRQHTWLQPPFRVLFNLILEKAQ